MTARVIIHPRCLNGPASGALAATLAAHGLRMGEVAVPLRARRADGNLVELIGEQDGVLTLRRMDGATFEYDANDIDMTPGPSAA